MFRKLLYTLGMLLLMALFYMGVVIAGSENAASRETPASLPLTGSATASSLNDLALFMNCPLPQDRAAGIGSVQNASLGDLTARLLTWQAQDGLEISAVCPAEAAQLLRRDGLSLSAKRWSLDGVTLLTAESSVGACAYYDTPEAAYSFYLPGADADALLDRLAGSITFPAVDP